MINAALGKEPQRALESIRPVLAEGGRAGAPAFRWWDGGEQPE